MDWDVNALTSEEVRRRVETNGLGQIESVPRTKRKGKRFRRELVCSTTSAGAVAVLPDLCAGLERQ
jgi:hypothetical protein